MPETIGQQLKSAREARALTLGKITQATHIQARLLEAMEADNFEALPSPVQGRAFLRLYAGFLGLSLDDMITRQRLAAGDPAPAIISTSSTPGQALAPNEIPVDPSSPDLSSAPATGQDSTRDEIPGEPDPNEPAGEVHPGRLIPILEKIKGLLQRLRKPVVQPGETPTAVEAFQLSLPLVDPEPVAGLPAAQIVPPGLVPEPIADLPADPVEDWAEESEVDSQEQPLPSDGSASEQPASQRIFKGIGESLALRRTSLSLTLDEIERHTHVRIHYLQALERGDFDHLPSSVQTRGMLNNYAHFLDMDLDAILMQFAEGLQAKRLERQPKPEEEPRNAVQKLLPRVALPGGLRRYLSLDILVGGGLILTLFVFAIWGTSRVISLHAAVTPQSTAQSISDILAVSVGTVTFTPTPSLAGTETILPTMGVTEIGTIPAAGPGQVQVVVVSTEDSYLRVTVDGKSQFDGRIAQGTAYSFSGNTQIEVLTGNGAGISILFNQGNLGPMGRFGEVVDRIYTAKAILNPTATNTPTRTITPTPTITPRISPTPTLTKTPFLPPATP